MRYRLTGCDTESWLVGRELNAVAELDPRPGVVDDEQVAVEVDEVAEARDLSPGRDAEARLGHAAEHDAEPEGARRVGHPDRLADASGLRELDVDPVRPLGADGDVGERVAVLVDVDRDRRGGLDLGAGGIAFRQRLLAVLDSE